MNDLISVIVPVYNVEPYLRKCADSILAQTYTNLEVILVDDGSPDNCGAICDEYAARDERVRVIHKENGGLSDARNAGLNIMNGSYVAFVDSDDWIEPEMYERLMSIMHRYHADMAFGGVTDDCIREGQYVSVKTSDYGETPCAEDAIAAMRRYFYGSWAAWDKLYRADLFRTIRYPVGEINEDEAIVLQLLDQCERVCYTNEVFYHYIHRESGESITSSGFSKKKLAWQRHCRDNLAFVRAKYPELETAAAKRYRDSIMWSLSEIVMLPAWKAFQPDIQEMISELRNNSLLFKRVGYQNAKEALRVQALTRFGFSVYAKLLRLKRGLLP